MFDEKFKDMTVAHKMARVIIDLRKIRPFYSAVYETIKKVEILDNPVLTMSVTTDSLLYNPKFVEKIHYEEFLFNICHEISHIALLHVLRRQNRDSIIWNIACDYYVNKLLAEEFDLHPENKQYNAKFNIAFCDDKLFDGSINIEEQSCEDIYERLLEEYKSEDSDSILASSKTNRRVVPDGYTPDLMEDTGDCVIPQMQLEQIASEMLSKAIVNAEVIGLNGIGQTSCILERNVKKLVKGRIDWKKVLRKYLRTASLTDTSFRRLDKRYIYANRIVPGQIEDDKQKLEGIKICIDASGSVSDEDLAVFLGQVYKMCKQFKVSAEVIYWDTLITSKGSFKGYAEFERVNQAGGGGTDPACVFEYFSSKECKVKPVVTIVFTDGYLGKNFDTITNKRKYKDTLWILNETGNQNFKPSFGKVVPYKKN